jgi:K+-transporting ATPase ATPase B chain
VFGLQWENKARQFVYNVIVTAVLLITLLFANFAEAIAEARGKAQADSLEKQEKKLLQNGLIQRRNQ